MKKSWIIGGLSVALLGSTAVFAAHHGKGHGVGMKIMDADGNGVVTKAEAKAAADARFTKMDADGNGQLDAADKSARVKARFAQMDADGNGSVNEAEFIAAHEARQGKFRNGKGKGRMMRHIKRVDSNGDDIISRDEFNAAAEARFARRDADGNGEISGDELKRGKGMKRWQKGN